MCRYLHIEYKEMKIDFNERGAILEGNLKKRILWVEQTAKRYRELVAERQKENLCCEMGADCFKDTFILPTPFEIADFYGIKYTFRKMDGEIPAYMNVKEKTIYISDKYVNDGYRAKQLCAHELGHYFLHMDVDSGFAMNNDELNEYLPEEELLEYDANLFSIMLMPQLMGKNNWENYSPSELNKMLYEKVIK